MYAAVDSPIGPDGYFLLSPFIDDSYLKALVDGFH
jgi:hypothetical protein